MRGLLSSSITLASSLSVLVVPTSSQQDTSSLPVIDLGYERHQALAYNSTTEVYTFQNIRYAQNPTGNLRFRAPAAPLTNRTSVQLGNETRMCPQGVPMWQNEVFFPVGKYSDPANVFTLQAWEADIAKHVISPGDPNTGASEDCLFLDLYVTKNVLENASQGNGSGAPILFWIHGGGFVLGSKQGTPEPSYFPPGLFEHAAANSDDGLIFVAINYRLGALGFSYSPEVIADGDLNVGLLDQRFALQWVQNNIHLFGGDKNRVTVMGESAGAGSILYHMLAYGGAKAPFHQGIPQSPAIPTPFMPADTYQNFLNLLNVTNLEEARNADAQALIAANAAQIVVANSTAYIYNPIIDGDFVRDIPAQALKAGKFDQSVKVMTGHNMFEGAFFYNPNVTTDAEFKSWINISAPGLNETEIEYLATTLYPEVYDGSYGYVDKDNRMMRLWSEAIIDCNHLLIGQMTKGNSYAYEFGVSPGFHIQDLSYTFNNPANPGGAAPFPKAQDALQEAIVTFVRGGTPLLSGTKKPFPIVGSHASLVNITVDGPVVAPSRVNATRCAWWVNAFGK